MELRLNECYTTTSHEERLEILGELHANGVEIGPSTWRDRNKPGDQIEYPMIRKSESGYICVTGINCGRIQLTCDEFKEKVGLSKPTRVKITRHRFI